MKITNIFQSKGKEEPTKITRRPDIDMLSVIITWVVLLTHTVMAYTPIVASYYPVMDPNLPSVNINNITVLSEIDSPDDYGFMIYLLFVNTWIMPIFFFLSGVNSYFSLKRYDINLFAF